MPDGAVFPQVRLQSWVAGRNDRPVKCPRAESARRAQARASIDVPFDIDLIRDAIALLSDRHRAVIYRSLCLKRTTMQIANELRTDDQLVKQDLHHALHALRTTLQGAIERPAR
jgi:DNA-directed RNA polymerase specialized sigma24 family protein